MSDFKSEPIDAPHANSVLWDVAYAVGLANGNPDGFWSSRGYFLFVCEQGILATALSRAGLFVEMGQALRDLPGAKTLVSIAGGLPRNEIRVDSKQIVDTGESTMVRYPWDRIERMAIRTLRLRPAFKIVIKRHGHKQDVLIRPKGTASEANALASALARFPVSCGREANWWF